MSDRVVDWDGCVNVRDLGGLPLRDGGLTRFGSVYRADNVRHLSQAGWSALRAHGVRTIVDLRYAGEGADTPPLDDLEIVSVSLFGLYDSEAVARVDESMLAATDDAEAVALLYTDALDRFAGEVAGAVRAIGDAKPGGVVVHCFVGKDRTGIVTAVLLDLVGVEHQAIALDYAMTEGRVGSLVDGWIALAEDEPQRSLRARVSTAPLRAMELTLEALTSRHGGAERYLREAGLAPDAIARAQARLSTAG